jgi:hypothetical protein
MANYDSTSPYFLTGYNQFYLDVMVDRPIPKESDDLNFTINLTYQYRPDLLAHDLYSDARLWCYSINATPTHSQSLQWILQ